MKIEMIFYEIYFRIIQKFKKYRKQFQKNWALRLLIPSGSVPQQPPMCVTALKFFKICSMALI
jgi:hypothetical protein